MAPNYQYTAAGRLSKRTWDRGDYVNYSYTVAGELRLVNYTDVTQPGGTTPDIDYSYNRTGTLPWAKDDTSDGSMITTLRYAHYNYFLAPSNHRQSQALRGAHPFRAGTLSTATITLAIVLPSRD